MLTLPLSSLESSQSEESSSSSMALSSISSSSSVSNTSSKGSSLMVLVATSSWNDVCFFAGLTVDIALFPEYLEGSEFSSSLDEPPNSNMLFFFCWTGGGRLSIEFVRSLIESADEDTPPRANIAFFLEGGAAVDVLAAAISAEGIDEGTLGRGIDRYEELICEGEKPLTTLVVLLSERALVAEESEEGICAERSDAESEVKDSMMMGAGNCGMSSATCSGS